MTQSAVLLKNVTLTLPSRAGNVEILRGVDLSVNTGEAIGIVGPSGSGKTSLLMLIAGLERATSGILEVAGTVLEGKNEDSLAAFRRDTIGIIFQSFHLIPTMTALENVAVPLEFRGVADAMTVAEEKLNRVGLGHRLTHYPGQLSGGEQQRVAIALALANDPALILADEPTGNLDTANAAAIAKLLRGLATDYGKTVIMVSHDPKTVEHFPTVFSMRDGEFVQAA
jgi:putative ABC transport system ATP-binding protein